MFILFGGLATQGFTSNINLNDTAMTGEEIDAGGATGISIGRFISLVGFGVGLPSDTPLFVSVIFIAWQTLLTIFTVGFLISSIWDG